MAARLPIRRLRHRVQRPATSVPASPLATCRRTSIRRTPPAPPCKWRRTPATPTPTYSGSVVGAPTRKSWVHDETGVFAGFQLPRDRMWPRRPRRVARRHRRPGEPGVHGVSPRHDRQSRRGADRRWHPHLAPASQAQGPTPGAPGQHRGRRQVTTDQFVTLTDDSGTIAVDVPARGPTSTPPRWRASSHKIEATPMAAPSTLQRG